MIIADGAITGLFAGAIICGVLGAVIGVIGVIGGILTDAAEDEEEQPATKNSGEEKKESPTGLRTVVLPGDLVSRFLDIAKVNSDRGIETLGTFGGQLCNNQFVVTHLLIPRQVGKSDR